MAKQSHIDQLKQLKERDEFNREWYFHDRLGEIDRLLNTLDDHKIIDSDPLMKYIPMATVACLEGSFRAIVKDLIDRGKPFSENAVELDKKLNIKITFEVLFEIQSRNFTSGELIAHALPCSRLEDINSAISTILRVDFLDDLKKFQRATKFDHVAREFEYFQTHYSSVYEDVKRLFELRHIFAHEIARNYTINKHEIMRCYTNGKFFMKQMAAYIQQITDADNFEDIEATKEKYRQKASIVNDAIEKLFARTDPKPNLFEILFQEEKEQAYRHAVEAWRNYREKKAVLSSKRSFGGNWSELSYYQNYIQITQDMIDHLTKAGTFY